MIPKEFVREPDKEIPQPLPATQSSVVLCAVEQHIHLDSFICRDCSKSLSKNNVMFAIEKIKCDIITVCNLCLDRLILLKHVIYFDNLSTFEKRFKVGQVKQIVEEYLKHEENKRNSSN